MRVSGFAISPHLRACQLACFYFTGAEEDKGLLGQTQPGKQQEMAVSVPLCSPSFMGATQMGQMDAANSAGVLPPRNTELGHGRLCFLQAVRLLLFLQEVSFHPTHLIQEQPGPCTLHTPSKNSEDAQLHGRWPLCTGPGRADRQNPI